MTTPVPAFLDANSTTRGPSGDIDVYYENFLETGTFGEGTILRMNLMVPMNNMEKVVRITAVPDTFDDGTQSIPAEGRTFTLFIPEPTVGVLFALGAALGWWHRPRRWKPAR